MVAQVMENPLDCGSQRGKAKSRKGRLVRRPGLGLDDWRHISRQLRRRRDLHPAAKAKKLARVLTGNQSILSGVDAAVGQGQQHRSRRPRPPVGTRLMADADLQLVGRSAGMSAWTASLRTSTRRRHWAWS